MPGWAAVERWLEAVLDDVRVVVDNGQSFDRLDYSRADSEGNRLPETVIAIGGGTLSRGLTLEGLVVSYFTRTSNTYDTLLQMGRWFGFRSGYEDLPRMWLQRSLEQEFRFLALVEEEIRRDMRDMERMRKTPRELGVRVRAHPGRLEIVARNKMQHAEKVRITYSGQRMQTFILHELDQGVIAANQEAARNAVRRATELAPAVKAPNRARWLIKDLPTEVVTQLLKTYQFHPEQLSLKSEDMVGWIQNAIPERSWNLVVAGGKTGPSLVNGELTDLGSMDLGMGEPVPAINRSPLASSDPGVANLKALLSTEDWFADLDRSKIKSLEEAKKNPREVRRELANGRGLILLMPISRHSGPGRAQAQIASRRRMRAPDHLMGVGIIFPEVDEGNPGSAAYYSVMADWEPEMVDEFEPPEDREADFDGAAI